MEKSGYLRVLLIAIVMFVLFFMGMYTFTVIKVKVDEPTELKREEMVFVEPVEEVAKPEYVVLPTTQITLKILDEEENIVSREAVDAISLLGCTEEEVRQKFQGFEVIIFNEEEVLIEKIERLPSRPAEYRLGVEDGEIGIVTKGRNMAFEPIGISVTDFSGYTNLLLLNEVIQINSSQKKALIENPYYIEHIFQNYSE